jgi:hypothetical protein
VVVKIEIQNQLQKSLMGLLYAGGIVLLLYSSTGHGGHGPLVVFASAVQRSARLAGERWGVCVLAPVWFLDASMKMLMVGWNAVHLLE